MASDDTNPDPSEDESYQRFLVAAARDCRCCSDCSFAPCAGVCAGGLCDQMCWCDRDDERDPYDDDE